MKLASLRIRVISWYVGMLALALFAFGIAVFLSIGGYLQKSLESSLIAQADGIAGNLLSQAGSKGALWLSDEVVESYAPEISGRFIRITTLAGKVLYQSGDTREPLITADRITPLPPSLKNPGFREESPNGPPAVLIYALPYRAPDGSSYLVEVGASRGPIYHTLRGLAITLLLVTPVILIGAAVSGYLLMKQPLKPIAALTDQAERIGAENFSERLPVIRSGDELERLSLSLNRMLSRLEDAIAHIHRFSGDVSHELRTPLTVMHGELEHVAQIEGLQPEVIDAVWTALEEVERLSRIVNSLLVISRLDYGDAGMEKTCVNLGALARDTAEQMQALAEDKSISIACRLESVEVLGDETRLRQVVVNLLDNAIKYTRDGGHIEFLAGRRGNRAWLQVSDDGIGIPADALPHVFERFYRADKARSRASGGAGLGLSIVKAICSAHSGEISVVSTEGRGTTFTVEFPLYATVQDGRGKPEPDTSRFYASPRGGVARGTPSQ
jgi:heavy metal sensor kinase